MPMSNVRRSAPRVYGEEYLFVHDSRDRHAVEAFREGLPQFDAVPAEADGV